MIKVLFMDIDGVLNSEDWLRRRGAGEPGRMADPEYMAERALDPVAVWLVSNIVARTGCKVVLSSTWRVDGIGRVQKLLNRVGAKFELYDATPDCAQQVGSLFIGAERGAEIQEWLAKHPETERFAIVDDSDDIGPLKDHLVRTSHDRGLTLRETSLLIKALGEAHAD